METFLSFFFSNFCFCSLFLLKQKFYFVVYFTFLVTKTKIRNSKAVFQADSPIKVVETLHGSVGAVVSVRSSESV